MKDEIRKILRRERRLAEITQRELAETMGFSQATIAAIESGRQPFREEYVSLLPEPLRQKVAAAFLAEHEAAIARLLDA